MGQDLTHLRRRIEHHDQVVAVRLQILNDLGLHFHQFGKITLYPSDARQVTELPLPGRIIGMARAGADRIGRFLQPHQPGIGEQDQLPLRQYFE